MVTLNVNNNNFDLDIDNDTPLLWAIRDAAGLTGTKYECGRALSSAITLKEGVVEQSNFDGYQVLRMNQMPEVEVHIVESNANPSGVGEPGTPPIAPVVVNAIAAATGKHYHELPLPSSV